jgi:UTP-glucose-1-phosphate uridylyltransferase
MNNPQPERLGVGGAISYFEAMIYDSSFKVVAVDFLVIYRDK